MGPRLLALVSNGTGPRLLALVSNGMGPMLLALVSNASRLRAARIIK